MVAKYLEDFRRAVAEMEQAKAAKQSVTHDEVNEVTKLLPDSSPITSSTSLTSYLSTLERRCPPLSDRWQQCLSDGRRFVADWGSQATALGWTVDNLFGLHTPSEHPHPSYSRLSRLDCTGLVWPLQGARVTALSSSTAALDTGLKYRRTP
jgi:hypothetical protein